MQCNLVKFASSCGAAVSRCWKPNVTHVIAATDANGAYTRTLKVLMAILNGRWIVTMDCKLSSDSRNLCLNNAVVNFGGLLHEVHESFSWLFVEAPLHSFKVFFLLMKSTLNHMILEGPTHNLILTL